MYYDWLQQTLQREYEQVASLKASEHGDITLLKNRASGVPIVLRRFRGDYSVYRCLWASGTPICR